MIRILKRLPYIPLRQWYIEINVEIFRILGWLPHIWHKMKQAKAHRKTLKFSNMIARSWHKTVILFRTYNFTDHWNHGWLLHPCTFLKSFLEVCGDSNLQILCIWYFWIASVYSDIINYRPWLIFSWLWWFCSSLSSFKYATVKERKG